MGEMARVRKSNVAAQRLLYDGQVSQLTSCSLKAARLIGRAKLGTLVGLVAWVLEPRGGTFLDSGGRRAELTISHQRTLAVG